MLYKIIVTSIHAGKEHVRHNAIFEDTKGFKKSFSYWKSRTKKWTEKYANVYYKIETFKIPASWQPCIETGEDEQDILI